MVKNILVIGDSCIDEYIYCSTDRFCPDAPVPVLKPEAYVSTEGMAGNVADNLRAILDTGCNNCKKSTVDLVTNANQIKKTRYVDERTNHMFVRIDEGENDIFPIEQRTLESIQWDKYDAVVISDYDKGFLTEDNIKFISNSHPLTFLDTKKKLNGYAENVSYIKINDVEYNITTETLTPEYNEKMIITRGSKGAEYDGVIYPVEEVDVRDTSGAGDTFLAGLVYKYLEYNNIGLAVQFANKCATQVVQKKGTAKINQTEL